MRCCRATKINGLQVTESFSQFEDRSSIIRTSDSEIEFEGWETGAREWETGAREWETEQHCEWETGARVVI